MPRTAQILSTLAVCVLISAVAHAGPTPVPGGFFTGTQTSRPFQLYGDGLALSGNSEDANLGPLESCQPCTNRSTVSFSARFDGSRIGPPGTFNGIHYDQVYLGGLMDISAPRASAAALRRRRQGGSSGLQAVHGTVVHSAVERWLLDQHRGPLGSRHRYADQRAALAGSDRIEPVDGFPCLRWFSQLLWLGRSSSA